MSDVLEFQRILRESREVAIKSEAQALVSGQYFDICTVNAIRDHVSLNNRGAVELPARENTDMELLSSIHCMHYDKMTPELLRVLPAMLARVTGLDADVFAGIAAKQAPLERQVRSIDECTPLGRTVIRDLLAEIAKDDNLPSWSVRTLCEVCKSEGFAQAADINKIMVRIDALSGRPYRKMSAELREQLVAAIAEASGLPVESIALRPEPADAAKARGFRFPILRRIAAAAVVVLALWGLSIAVQEAKVEREKEAIARSLPLASAPPPGFVLPSAVRPVEAK